MMFRHVGSPQKDAAPLQSFIKQQNLGQFVPDQSTTAMAPNVPNAKQGWTTPAGKASKNMPFLEPVFMHLIGKYMGG